MPGLYVANPNVDYQGAKFDLQSPVKDVVAGADFVSSVAHRIEKRFKMLRGKEEGKKEDPPEKVEEETVEEEKVEEKRNVEECAVDNVDLAPKKLDFGGSSPCTPRLFPLDVSEPSTPLNSSAQNSPLPPPRSPLESEIFTLIRSTRLKADDIHNRSMGRLKKAKSKRKGQLLLQATG